MATTALTGLLLVAADGAAAATLTAAATPAELTYGATVTIAGSVAESQAPLAEQPLELEADPYPYRGYRPIARRLSASDGSFSFAGLRPTRNTRMRVLTSAATPAASPALQIVVDPFVAIASASLGPGRDRLSVRVGHAPDLDSPTVAAWWYLAARGSTSFRLAAVTATREISPGLTYASALVDPPSRHFGYRVCLNPGWEAAMGPAAAHGPCPRQDFRLAGAI